METNVQPKADGNFSFEHEVDHGKLIGELALQIAFIRADLNVILEQQARIAKRVGLSETNFREGTMQARQGGWKEYLAQIEERLAALQPAPKEALQE